MQHTLRLSSLSAGIVGLMFLFAVPLLAHAAVTTVTMTDNVYTPKSVSITVGDTVTWVNQGSVHTATSDSGNFDSGPIQNGQQFSATFNQAGIYSYHDFYNGGLNGAGMAGSVIVNANTIGSTYSGAYSNPNSGYFAPTTTNAPVYNGSPSSVAQLTAQVQSLLAQINALRASGAVGGTAVPIYTGTTGISSVGAGVNSSACPNIGRVLKLESTGDDVTRLQQFLARDPSVYPEAQVSGYYGALTQAAVQRWQTKYNIVSSGSPDTTGFGVAGPRTAAAISLQCSTVGAGGTVPSGGTGAPVGGFIQVTPISGNAPLSVNVTANVNTGGSCVPATYTLNFGDGTVPQQIQTSSSCSQQSQTYQHTYIYGGTYQVTLSAGSHTTGTAVTVNGPAAPAGSGVGTGPAGQARGTISAFTTTGNAPLNVSFYVSCAAGTAYNVVFGDGSDLGSTAVAGTKCGTGGLDSISHTYTSAGGFLAKLIIFSQQANGTVTPTDAASVSITVGTVASGYSYNPPQLSPGGSTLSFGVQFDLPTACTGYDLSWGDGTAHAIQTDGGSGCAQTTTIKNLSHTYAQTGSYTLTLRRGASLGKTDTIGVTVAQ